MKIISLRKMEENNVINVENNNGVIENRSSYSLTSYGKKFTKKLFGFRNYINKVYSKTDKLIDLDIMINYSAIYGSTNRLLREVSKKSKKLLTIRFIIKNF